jgi:hypothetical protein
MYYRLKESDFESIKLAPGVTGTSLKDLAVEISDKFPVPCRLIPVAGPGDELVMEYRLKDKVARINLEAADNEFDILVTLLEVCQKDQVIEFGNDYGAAVELALKHLGDPYGILSKDVRNLEIDLVSLKETVIRMNERMANHFECIWDKIGGLCQPD